MAPVLWAFLLLFLCVNAAFLPDWAAKFGRGGTTISRLIGTGPRGSRRDTLYFVAIEGTRHVVRSESEEESPNRSGTRSEFIISENYRHRVAGVWSPVSAKYSSIVRVDCESQGIAEAAPRDVFSETAWTEIYAGLVRIDPNRFTPELQADDFAGGPVAQRIIWTGVANDLVVAVCIGTLLLGVVLNIQHRWRTRTLSSLPPHICRGCRYDLRGSSAKVCPECGTPHAYNFSLI